MSDYFMTHEVKQRIGDLQHLRAQTRHAAEQTAPNQRLKVQPVHLASVVNVILNAITHIQAFSQAVPPALRRHPIPERTPLAVDRAPRP